MDYAHREACRRAVAPGTPKAPAPFARFDQATTGAAIGVNGGKSSPTGTAVNGFNNATSGFAVGVQGGTGVGGFNSATTGFATGMKNTYDGVVRLADGGEAVVTLADWFESLNKDFRYQLTCIGGFAPVYIAEKIARKPVQDRRRQ